jgi:putative Holliday junction resolvase|tara:strand:+ start:2630 stop:3043 length:414 start_codon:yes stop_codon:yes gene_type:complete
MIFLGIDYGTKRIGLAKSDPSGTLSTPFETLSSKNDPFLDSELIIEKLTETNAECLVIGLPLNMNGTSGEMVRKVRKLIFSIRKKSSVPIKEWDERLTSVQATKIINTKKNKMGRSSVDSISAALILESYLLSSSHK